MLLFVQAEVRFQMIVDSVILKVSWLLHNRLVHFKGVLWIVLRVESLDVLHVFSLEQVQVFGKHFPVQLFSDELLSLVLFILGFSVVIDVRVEALEGVPLSYQFAEVVDVLFPHVQEVFSAVEVVQHDSSPHFVEQLLLEVLTFIQKLLQSLGLFWEHELLGLLEVVSDLVYFFDHSWVLDVPSFVVLFSKQLDFLSVEGLACILKPSIRPYHEGMSLSKCCRTLVSLIFELRVELVVDHESLMDGEFSCHLHDIAHSLVQIAELRNLYSLKTQLIQVV